MKPRPGGFELLELRMLEPTAKPEQEGRDLAPLGELVRDPVQRAALFPERAVATRASLRRALGDQLDRAEWTMRWDVHARTVDGGGLGSIGIDPEPCCGNVRSASVTAAEPSACGFPASTGRISPMPVRERLPNIRHMTYAVLWRTGRGPVHAGRLALQERALVLDGTSRGVAGTCELGYDEIVAVDVERDAALRLGGRPVTVIRSVGGETVEVAMLGGAGLLPELVEQLDAARVV